MSGLYTRIYGMDYAVSGNELAALFLLRRGAVPVGGDLPLEMGLRSPGRRWAGLSRFCLSELWRKGYRILQGISGAVIILCSAVLWVLM